MNQRIQLQRRPLWSIPPQSWSQPWLRRLRLRSWMPPPRECLRSSQRRRWLRLQVCSWWCCCALFALQCSEAAGIGVTDGERRQALCAEPRVDRARLSSLAPLHDGRSPLARSLVDACCPPTGSLARLAHRAVLLLPSLSRAPCVSLLVVRHRSFTRPACCSSHLHSSALCPLHSPSMSSLPLPLVSSTNAWHALETHAASPAIAASHLKHMLQDGQRAAAMQAEFDGIMLDYSRQRITQDTINMLFGQTSGERSPSSEGERAAVERQRQATYLADSALSFSVFSVALSRSRREHQCARQGAAAA